MSDLPASGAWFGAGGAEPWNRVVRRGGGDLLLVADGGDRPGWAEPLDAGRWSRTADEADRSALVGLTGPVLDVGCGPGRMVRAALDAGLGATGIDVSRTVVRHCRRRGLPVLQRSVFDPLPREGGWGAVLLLDGNLGIGGGPAALLQRCRELLRPGGDVVVETHPDPARDAVFTGRVLDGTASSAPFPWSQTGEHAVLRVAADLDLRPGTAWTADGRRFLRLHRP